MPACAKLIKNGPIDYQYDYRSGSNPKARPAGFSVLAGGRKQSRFRGFAVEKLWVYGANNPVTFTDHTGLEVTPITAGSFQDWMHIVGTNIDSPANLAKSKAIFNNLKSTQTGSKLLNALNEADGYNFQIAVSDSLRFKSDFGGTLFDDDGGAVTVERHCDRKTGKLKPGNYLLVIDKDFATRHHTDMTVLMGHELGHAHIGVYDGQWSKAAIKDSVNADLYRRGEELDVINSWENPLRSDLRLKRRPTLGIPRD